ncbi:putative nuclease HARBI1 [Rhagoletis pomonella]|uniref:putative nuclease HARBI1 n=1 Tax=Rhagoletis pomonella TaxID=28610 RepID=UPI001786D884|nr:putative nuclease HARBI1 [Rhagoletis pomonella]
MAEQILVICAAVLVEDEQNLERKRLLRELRDDSDPFSMQEIVFIQNFRFPKSLCRELMQQLEPRDPQKSAIPFIIRFLGSLYFYAHGSYQKCVGNNFQIAMSQPSVSRAIHNISKIIMDVKGGEIKFPKTSNEVLDVKKGFYTAFKIKGTIGAVDCTHIGIVAPSSTDPSNPLCMYMNRKGFYSIHVEAVCDHRL